MIDISSESQLPETRGEFRGPLSVQPDRGSNLCAGLGGLANAHWAQSRICKLEGQDDSRELTCNLQSLHVLKSIYVRACFAYINSNFRPIAGDSPSSMFNGCHQRGRIAMVRDTQQPAHVESVLMVWRVGDTAYPLVPTNLYPTPGTVRINAGCRGLSSSFSRKLATCISTVRVNVVLS